MAGKNRAYIIKSLRSFTEAEALKRQRPCIFLSHIAIDKSIAINIGDYIMEKGDIDIYLDIYDEKLQQAVAAENPQMVTKFIEEGLEQSTHIMCLVSRETIRSWWVPYELGYGKRALKELSTLTLKGVINLPQYLEISVILRGTKSLNEYLGKMTSSVFKGILGESYRGGLISHSSMRHPLDNYLDWNQ
jgi:hypothetical protein